VLDLRRPGIGLGVAATCVLGGGVAWLVTYDGRQDIDLQQWAADDGSWARQLMPGARTATDELCSHELPCVQALTSDTLTMYRFASEDEAADAARRFGGDAYLSHWIVVRFEPEALTPAQRREFGRSLDCVDVGIADDGTEC